MTHAVGNTIKRVVIILASVIVFKNPLTPLGAPAEVPSETLSNGSASGVLKYCIAPVLFSAIYAVSEVLAGSCLVFSAIHVGLNFL